MSGSKISVWFLLFALDLCVLSFLLKAHGNSLPKISIYMYCILTLSDIVWKMWDEMASLEEQMNVCSWSLPLRVSHCPFIPCLPAFLCLFIYSDIKGYKRPMGFYIAYLKIYLHLWPITIEWKLDMK